MSLPIFLVSALLMQPLELPHSLSKDLSTKALWVDFGRIEVGDTTTETVDLINATQRPIEITDIDVSGDDAFNVNDSDCDGRTLAVGDRCQIDIHFEPEEAGEFSGEIEVESSLSDVEIQLEGEAVYRER